MAASPPCVDPHAMCPAIRVHGAILEGVTETWPYAARIWPRAAWKWPCADEMWPCAGRTWLYADKRWPCAGKKWPCACRKRPCATRFCPWGARRWPWRRADYARVGGLWSRSVRRSRDSRHDRPRGALLRSRRATPSLKSRCAMSDARRAGNAVWQRAHSGCFPDSWPFPSA